METAERGNRINNDVTFDEYLNEEIIESIRNIFFDAPGDLNGLKRVFLYGYNYNVHRDEE